VEKLPGRHAQILVLMLVVLGTTAQCQSEPRVDPESGRIRLLVVGEQNGGNLYVMSVIRSDPRIRHYATVLAGAGADLDEAKRQARIYTPRTRERFVSSIDVINFLDAPPWGFTDAQQEWIRDGIYQIGMGLVLVEMGWHSCNYAWWHCNRPDIWMTSPIYAAWPVDAVLEKTVRPSVYADIIESSPVVDLPGFEKQPYGGPAHNTGLLIARPGSTVHARWRVGKEDAIVSARYGQGTTLNLPTGWDCLSPLMMRNWKYFVDFILNSLYQAAQVPVPDDPELAHTLRAGFIQFDEQRTLMLHLIDFIDKFGANTAPLHEMLDELVVESRGATGFYLEGEYSRSWEAIQEALEGLTRITEESTRLRQKALFWVYVTEWLSISGTSMACGFVLWTVMVRRRYYREVQSTRLDSRVS